MSQFKDDNKERGVNPLTKTVHETFSVLLVIFFLIFSNRVTEADLEDK